MLTDESLLVTRETRDDEHCTETRDGVSGVGSTLRDLSERVCARVQPPPGASVSVELSSAGPGLTAHSGRASPPVLAGPACLYRWQPLSCLLSLYRAHRRTGGLMGELTHISPWSAQDTDHLTRSDPGFLVSHTHIHSRINRIIYF